MIDHVSIGVRDIAAAKRFYDGSTRQWRAGHTR
jgi:catechol 2,3-dioxygenase-like lactoylglutathione lyase family enzyme